MDDTFATMNYKSVLKKMLDEIYLDRKSKKYTLRKNLRKEKIKRIWMMS